MEPPNHPLITINIDGSFTPSNKQGGAGGVFRDHIGKWLTGFTTNFFYSSSNQTKIWALKYVVEIVISQ